RGLRVSAFNSFIKPVIDKRHRNLRLEMKVMVERVVIEDGRATAVEFTHGGEQLRADVNGEVILSAGAVGSPALLERSGIGQGERLQALGLATVRERAGVGQNLTDNLRIRPVYKVEGVRTLNTDYGKLWRRPLMALEYAARRTGPLTMAPSQMGAFVKSSPDYATANLQFHFQPLSLDKWGDGLHQFGAFTASVCNLRPSSRGSVHLRSLKAGGAPSISPNYLATDEDKRGAVDAMKIARRIVSQAPLARFRPQEHSPGPQATSDEALLKAAETLST